MKVVLFCGGLGLRMREASERVPKPMVPLGTRPMLWHIMKFYAHHGHKDFVLCLGHKGEVIKDYFLNYSEAMSNDFVLEPGGRVELLAQDIHEWTIAFVNTGLRALVGQRLMAVRPMLEKEEFFLATYGDGLTDAPLPRMIDLLRESGKVALMLMVRPSLSFHTVEARDDGLVTAVRTIDDANLWINGGYFVFRREIFDYMRPGEELVHEPFARLVADGELLAWRHLGFFQPMDTLKDKEMLEAMLDQGNGPWRVWETANGIVPAPRQ